MNNNEKRELIKNTTKRNQRIAREYCEYYYSNCKLKLTDLRQAYAKPSYKKEKAWDYCKNLCSILDGFDLCVSAHSCDFFSVVFKFKVDEKLCYAYITAKNDRFCFADI